MLKRLILFVLLGAAVAVGIYMASLPDVTLLAKKNPSTWAMRELRETQAQRAGKRIRSSSEWRNLDRIAPSLQHAVVLAEDDRFYQHSGFDVEQIRNAIEINWEKRRFAYGGSTITQQLARTLYLSPRKNLLRKAKEALITWQLEKHLSKHRILELYLNVAEWGTGVYGAESASQHYFHKSAADLTAEEAVSLAAILPSPRRWNPLSQKGFMNRRKTILYNRMIAAGHIPIEISSGTAQLLDVERMVQEKGGEVIPQEHPDDDEETDSFLHPTAPAVSDNAANVEEH